jgi:hypothetical protein
MYLMIETGLHEDGYKSMCPQSSSKLEITREDVVTCNSCKTVGQHFGMF